MYCDKTNQTVLFTLLSQKTVEKASLQNLKLIKNILPIKSGNPESHQKIRLESTPTNVLIAGKGLLMTSCKLLYLQIVFQMTSEKSLFRKGFAGNLRNIFI